MIFPALAEGKLVLCDRYKDATRAYQGKGRELPDDLIETLNRLDLLALEPDLTLLFDLDPVVALSRARYREMDRRPDEARFEQEEMDFHARVRQGYLDLASAYPGRIRVVDAVGKPAEVHRRVLGLLNAAFPSLDLKP